MHCKNKMTEQIAPIHNATLQKRAFSDGFFRSQEGATDVDGLIGKHELWLREQLSRYGLPADDRTWNHFYDGNVATSLGADVPSLSVLNRRTYESVRNVLQALAWHYAPEGASWKTPQFAVNVPRALGKLVEQEAIDNIATNAAEGRSRWFYQDPQNHYKSLLRHYHPPEDTLGAQFVLTVNTHYEGIQGSLAYADKDKYACRGINGRYDPDKHIFTVSFSNPADFMGWYVRKDGALGYKLDYLSGFIHDITEALKSDQRDIIGIDTWKAY